MRWSLVYRLLVWLFTAASRGHGSTMSKIKGKGDLLTGKKEGFKGRPKLRASCVSKKEISAPKVGKEGFSLSRFLLLGVGGTVNPRLRGCVNKDPARL